MVSCSEQDAPTDPGMNGDPTDLLKPGASTASLSITSLSHATAEIADVLVINGNKFGDTQGNNCIVTVNGIDVTVYLSWSNTSISVVVPSGSLPGPGTIVVKIRNKSSNAYPFTLLASTPVTIGTQTWMGANLDVSSYANGDPIPQVTDPTTWLTLTTGAWCYPNNDPVLGSFYGKLYNWYAVNDSRGLAPQGWHVPSENEWKTLFMYLGMTQAEADGYGYPPNAYYGTDEGGKLKEAGTNLWRVYQNVGATNSTGFTALPGGYRHMGGGFDGIETAAIWWSATEANIDATPRAWMRMVVYAYANTYHNALPKVMGLSVRCIQNNN